MTSRKTRDLSVANTMVEIAYSMHIPATIEDRNKYGWYKVNFDVPEISSRWVTLRAIIKTTARTKK